MTAAFRLQPTHHENPDRFIAAMAGAATQVSVVTTDGRAGRFGVTVSAFSSVSAEPPLVLVCINRRSPAIAAIEANDAFCVNLLGDDQSEIANCFAGRPGGLTPYDFTCADWRSAATGAPVLTGAIANFDCTVEATYDAGTHRIFIGRVQQALSRDAAPLAFSKRAYQALRPL
ncbi:flavin reductase family protein [Roseovarius aestuarii]|uniref:FMN reductase (NADH) NtaB n=1 Tax=Roseovarius aestuarii TaxID=475083 RepID=A0A1X7BR79_9RHOB|nr:flavin reductase family protein [Roseovarius aestuarii]SMC12095.1 FMN reductase (NADH) NtaB [Roseovarius aestuarii]